MLSIIYPLLVSRHSTPIMQCNCYFPSQITHPTSTPTCQPNRSKSLRFAQFPLHLFTPTPLSYQHTLRPTLPHNLFPIIKLFFPRRFLLSTPLTTQTKTLPQPHKLSSIYFQLYNPRHFHLKRHSISHFDSTSTRLHPTFIY